MLSDRWPITTICPIAAGNDAHVLSALAVGRHCAVSIHGDREYIGGRAQHRAHLKEHRLIEVGNDTQAILNPPKVDQPKG